MVVVEVVVAFVVFAEACPERVEVEAAPVAEEADSLVELVGLVWNYLHLSKVFVVGIQSVVVPELVLVVVVVCCWAEEQTFL